MQIQLWRPTFGNSYCFRFSEPFYLDLSGDGKKFYPHDLGPIRGRFDAAIFTDEIRARNGKRYLLVKVENGKPLAAIRQAFMNRGYNVVDEIPLR